MVRTGAEVVGEGGWVGGQDDWGGLETMCAAQPPWSLQDRQTDSSWQTDVSGQTDSS